MRRARAIATSVFPTPVGPKSAITDGAIAPVWAARDAEYRPRRMGVRIACGLSTAPDPRAGAIEAAAKVAAALDGSTIDLAVVFASGAHLADPEATLAGVHEALEPAVLIGC